MKPDVAAFVAEVRELLDDERCLRYARFLQDVARQAAQRGFVTEGQRAAVKRIAAGSRAPEDTLPSERLRGGSRRYEGFTPGEYPRPTRR